MLALSTTGANIVTIPLSVQSISVDGLGNKESLFSSYHSTQHKGSLGDGHSPRSRDPSLIVCFFTN